MLKTTEIVTKANADNWRMPGMVMHENLQVARYSDGGHCALISL